MPYKKETGLTCRWVSGEGEVAPAKFVIAACGRGALGAQGKKRERYSHATATNACDNTRRTSGQGVLIAVCVLRDLMKRKGTGSAAHNIVWGERKCGGKEESITPLLVGGSSSKRKIEKNNFVLRDSWAIPWGKKKSQREGGKSGATAFESSLWNSHLRKSGLQQGLH